MKIAVSGSHRVGKSSLIEKLGEVFPDYICKPEPYYELEETGHFFSEIPDVDDYIVQLRYSIEQVVSTESNIIFDRCPLDLLAYIQASDEFGEMDIQSLFREVTDVMSEIDVLVFVAVEEPDIITCAESDLPELRIQVDEILREWVQDLDCTLIEVYGSLSNRKDMILKQIKKMN
ncbi:AAA family ATPase [Maribellus comscasis]|uniref:AAA family ATPase n=1 Tax=Maribellus comscasis TaxID=2681766 RepID=A0A6I6JWA1_9BACT|nr:ATP-binding protein [Maribellus comscasis]QGY45589.1 AAA family ATPase [Maribellus comscasis]